MDEKQVSITFSEFRQSTLQSYKSNYISQVLQGYEKLEPKEHVFEQIKCPAEATAAKAGIANDHTYFKRSKNPLTELKSNNKQLLKSDVYNENIKIEVDLLEDYNDENNNEQPLLCKRRVFQSPPRGERYRRQGLDPVRSTYICEFCSKNFRNKILFEKHVSRHREIVCHICHAQFMNNRLLKQHLPGHDPKFECSQCGKRFARKVSLKEHTMMAHQLHRPLKCAQCTAGFVNGWRLKAHMKFHKKERPFDCLLCDKAFYRRNDLERHTQTHRLSKIQPFKCDHCFKMFVTKGGLNGHKINHH